LTTAPYQTLDESRHSTFPITEALGATKHSAARAGYYRVEKEGLEGVGAQ